VKYNKEAGNTYEVIKIINQTRHEGILIALGISSINMIWI
jgi:hypothetical protein